MSWPDGQSGYRDSDSSRSYNTATRLQHADRPGKGTPAHLGGFSDRSSHHTMAPVDRVAIRDRAHSRKDKPPPYVPSNASSSRQTAPSKSSRRPLLPATAGDSHDRLSAAWKRDAATSSSYQPFPAAAAAASDTRSWKTISTRRGHGPGSHAPTRHTLEGASESGMSVLSHLNAQGHHPSSSTDRHAKRLLRQQTDSPLRRWTRWSAHQRSTARTLALSVAAVIVVKWCVGLGSYSGQMSTPMRGDFEAQRHWIAMTSSSVSSSWLHDPPGTEPERVPLSKWYFRDLGYWGLDYPPLTAYHSWLLGCIARLGAASTKYTTLRPLSDASTPEIDAWNDDMTRLERDGSMKHWMRGTVIASDLLVYVSAVVWFCWANYRKTRKATDSASKGNRAALVAILTILLQPGLILIDNGHFQYNSVMLGLTLWSVNFLQAGHDLLGAVAFVCSLAFKQMALYHSPAIFAYLLGKCLYRGGRDGTTLFVKLGFVTALTFGIIFAPFATSVTSITQVLHRIFPFARGLFEDKVANVWCALNVVVKLKQVASVPALARLALVATLVAVLPSVCGVLWVSHACGVRKRAEQQLIQGDAAVSPSTATTDDDKDDNHDVPPTSTLLPHALFLSSMAFFLLSFQVHEKSILLPLMPLTLLMGAREAGFGRLDWEWAVLVNNIGVFSMWPLLKRDGLGLEYATSLALWNVAIGYNPLSLRASFVKMLSLTAYAAAATLHLVELVAQPPRHLPDLFVVANVGLSASVFGLSFLWASKRLVQESWSVVGI